MPNIYIQVDLPVPLDPSRKAEVYILFSSRVNIVGIIAVKLPTSQALFS